ncbi:complement C1q tumor necrosis factor-related protein 3-like [Anneissia japonica]|uniref:complement C1q tumor necrosis factor-related protein 3-like n=1 Tax=Anneissia japonica TaxID=1529436 RepID=UPI0014257629|nr:complement C1q tumor necrosis factor-related protein 3-like [Anneissia japonica]
MYRQLISLLLLLFLCQRPVVAQETVDNEASKCICECQQYHEEREAEQEIPNYLPPQQPLFHGQPGIPGTPGINGNHGIPGMMGARGPKGERGLKGSKGEKCDSCQQLSKEPLADCNTITNCSTGRQGQKGDKGESGAKGEQGITGLPGVEKIQIAERTKVAFSAGRTKTMTSQEPGSVITYDTLFVNAGYDFDKDTGIFTCRINGTYYFVMHVANFYDVGDNNLYVELLKNNKHIVSVYHHDDSTYRDSVSNSVILHLVRGDKVKLFLEGNRHLYSSSRRFTTFSGYILFVD